VDDTFYEIYKGTGVNTLWRFDGYTGWHMVTEADGFTPVTPTLICAGMDGWGHPVVYFLDATLGNAPRQYSDYNGGVPSGALGASGAWDISAAGANEFFEEWGGNIWIHDDEGWQVI
jgi:hypothetical protein